MMSGVSIAYGVPGLLPVVIQSYTIQCYQVSVISEG